VADLDGDGQPEVVWSSSDLVVLNGSTGATRASVPMSGGNRTWGGVAVADIDHNGSLELVVGRNDGSVTAYRPTVTSGVMSLPVVAGWPTFPFPRPSPATGFYEVRALAVDDLDGDGNLETVVGRASGGNDQQVAAYSSSGALRPGWPAPAAGAPGFGWGVYNQNIAIGDLDGNGQKEIFVPTDTHYITALNPDGSQIGTNVKYDVANPVGPKVWRQVGVNVQEAADLAGFTDCDLFQRPNFANVAPAIGDFDGNGTLEFATTGSAYDCNIGDPDGDFAILPWIFNSDRSRWSGGGHDWTTIPATPPGSAPLSQDFSVIEDSVPNTVIADLDGDGERELIYPAYDGKVHAFWLDKTEHGNWPYTVPQGPGDIRFASEPVVADLNGDGQAEVIFTSWGQNNTPTPTRGQLHVLDSMGNPLFVITLPDSFPTGDWNGGLGAPTIANIDADADYELVIGTSNGGLVAYDLPGTAAARIQWGTGRGSNLRNGLQPEQIFDDGFELGGLSRWSSAVTDGGNLSVTPASGLGTPNGMQALVNDTNPLYVEDTGPDHEKHYRARFWFQPNGFDPGESQSHFRMRVFLAFQGTPNRRVAAIVLKRQGGAYSVMGRARLDGGAQADTGFFTIPDAPNQIEFDLRVSSGPLKNDGRFELFVNGASVSVLTGLDNDTAMVDYARMGAMGVKGGASGTLFFDRFASQRRSRIGP